MFLDQNISKFWGVPNLEDISGYLNAIPAYDIKLYLDTTAASWCTQLVKDAIRDVVLTSVAEEPLVEGDPNVVDASTSANLIYAKSLYENSLAYFDSAISRIEQELAEEQSVADQLSTNDAQLLTDLQTFVADKSAEVDTKVAHINQLNTDLQTLVA